MGIITEKISNAVGVDDTSPILQELAEVQLDFEEGKENLKEVLSLIKKYKDNVMSTSYQDSELIKLLVLVKLLADKSLLGTLIDRGNITFPETWSLAVLSAISQYQDQKNLEPSFGDALAIFNSL
jgi:hypothetical protein